MIKPTKEEISLCKQIAKKYRKPLKSFDPVLGTYLSGKEFVGYFHTALTKEKPRLNEVMIGLCGCAKTTKPMVPIWTISDCLKFLRKRDWIVELKDSATPEYGKYYCACFMPRDHPNRKHGIYKYANTTLETCLQVVLAVVEEKPK